MPLIRIHHRGIGVALITYYLPISRRLGTPILNDVPLIHRVVFARDDVVRFPQRVCLKVVARFLSMADNRNATSYTRGCHYGGLYVVA